MENGEGVLQEIYTISSHVLDDELNAPQSPACSDSKTKGEQAPAKGLDRK